MLRDPMATDADIAAQIQGPLRIRGGSYGFAPAPDGRHWATKLAMNRLEALMLGANPTEVLFEGLDFIWLDWTCRGLVSSQELIYPVVNDGQSPRI